MSFDDERARRTPSPPSPAAPLIDDDVYVTQFSRLSRKSMNSITFKMNKATLM